MQILTPKQTAQLMVLTYPHVGFSHVMLEAIATEYGEASKCDVEAMALVNPMAEEWQHFVQYRDAVTAKVHHDHVLLITYRPPHRLLSQY